MKRLNEFIDKGQMQAFCLEQAAKARMEPEPEPDPAAERRARQRWLSEIGFGARYWEPRWDLVVSELAAPLRDFCADLPERLRTGSGMLIGGGVGVGKTQSLALLALAAMGVRFLRVDGDLPQRPEVRYVFAPTLYERMFARDPEARADLRDWEQCDLLLLDDFDRIHASPQSDWLLGRVEAFAETRYATLRSTVVTFNNTAPLADPRLARTVDRWRETQQVVIVQGASRRKPLNGGDESAG